MDKVTKWKVVLDNGIVQVAFSIPEGYVTRIRYGGLDNILDANNKISQRGYWDTVATSNNLDNDEQNKIGIVGSSFKIINKTEDQVEISFLCPQMKSPSLKVDIRYVLLRGSSGFYSYAIFEREQGSPTLNVAQIRTVFKLQPKNFRYMAISDTIQRLMPLEQDRETGQTLAYKEAVLLTKPTNIKLKGQVDDKYQYACDDKDNKLHGWISTDDRIGIWMITASDEFRMGGPLKQDLTSHVGPTMLAMFHSTHYGGLNLIMKFKEGEAWKKVFGPYFVHLNSLPAGKGGHQMLWKNAKDQMLKEVKSWPYDFPLSKDYPKANERGSVEGRLLVSDGYLSKKQIPANYGWVGLSAPGDAGSWQTEMKGYQFWTQTDHEGKFLIKGVHVGTYNFYAWVPGYIGDFKSASIVNIQSGKQISLGDQVYTPPRNGDTLWEIGIPDRTSAEFFIPDPRPNLTNPVLFLDGSNKYKQYGLWDRYTDLYPKEDLIYTVGVSDFRKHWFFAHVLRRIGDKYESTTWQIVFPLKEVVPNSNYTLQIALASATESELQVRVNNPNIKSRPIFTTLLIGRDNAIARHGIHGLYILYSIGLKSELLKSGKNTIFLTQSRNNYEFRGIMYDYLRLEGPSFKSSLRKTLQEL
ncbi:probable rhamnogalacturonate lyase B [Spinacia oleracea]|uniref:rhamnogalacturonan endolyase n=1 Tax=Spinacia oleracea TaxID=3562 RepID=A0ABM3RNN7_SPIOL|nr:probable rhamnogalacturonate lyase B [Spinacia oleracea]